MDRKYKHTDVAEQMKMVELAGHGIQVAQIARLLDRSTSPVLKVFERTGIPVDPAARTTAQIDAALAALDNPAPAPIPRPSPNAPGRLAGSLRRAASAFGAHIVHSSDSQELAAVRREEALLILDLRRRIQGMLGVIDDYARSNRSNRS